MTDAVLGSPVTTPISPKTFGAHMRVTSFSAPFSARTFTSTSPLVSTYSQCADAYGARSGIVLRQIRQPVPHGVVRVALSSLAREVEADAVRRRERGDVRNRRRLQRVLDDVDHF